VAIQLGHEDGGLLVRQLYGHRDRARTLARIERAFADRLSVRKHLRRRGLMRPGGSVLQTRGLAAFLTWKQAEMLVILLEGGVMPTREISDLARELLNRDTAEGVRPMYWGVDDSSINSCLQGLLRRALVRRTADDKWALTLKGREAAETVR
jgi:hypothetical protein